MNIRYRRRAIVRERRRFLGLLGATSAACLALPWFPWRQDRERLSEREADFYRRGGR